MTTFETIFPLLIAFALGYAGCAYIWNENKKR